MFTATPPDFTVRLTARRSRVSWTLLTTLFCSIYILGVSSAPIAAELTEERIMKHIEVLAHDSLEGRQVGSDGEAKAAAYISEQFKEIGLEPLGDNGSYLQSFEFTSEIRPGENNSLTIGGVSYTLDSNYMPLKSSKSGSFSFDELVYVGFGIELESDSIEHHDYLDKDVAGKAVLISRFAPDGNEPHGPYYSVAGMDAKIAEALKREVAAIFFFTPEDQDDELSKGPRQRVSAKGVPIVFLNRSVFGEATPTPEALAEAKFELSVDLERVKDQGVNVAGLLTGEKPGAADRVVVIGAHFDHLGFGGPGSGSLYAGSDAQIHNGADDNASGTSGVIELARYFAAKKSEMDYSILFATFTGEESGLLGSNFLVKNPPIDTARFNFMVNMDMIGRMQDDEKGLGVFGVGTSPTFKEYFEGYDGELKINSKESGVGPSDHSAFYNSSIPVLHFFTGSHEDYHKPSDDVEKIQPTALKRVLEFVAARVEAFAANQERLVFNKTKDDAPGQSPRFTVTLGVMPDYLTEVKGLRIDGVTDDKPGQVAGMLAGDVIVKMGEYVVDDIYAYMAALARFHKGDTTMITVERGDERLDLEVIF